MDGDIPHDRPGNSADEDMNVWLSDTYSEDSDIEFEFELYDDENNELSVEFLQPTIGSLYKATTNEQDDFTSSAITNQWSHTASCSSGLATGITNLEPATQDRSQQYLTYQVPQNPQFRTDHAAFTQPEGVSSFEAFARTDTASVAYHQHMQHQSHHQQTMQYSQPQDLQIDLMDHIPENTLFRSVRAAIFLPKEPPSSEKTAHTDVQSAEIQQHSLHQQQPVPRHLLSQLVPRHLLSQPQNALMTAHNSQSFMIQEERKQSSSKSLVNQPTKSCPVQMISHETMEQLAYTFRNTRLMLGLTKEEVHSLLKKLSSNEMLLTWTALFANYSVVFKNMCQMKYLLEIFLDRIHNSRTTTNSLRNSQIEAHLSNDRADSTTVEYTDNQMCHGYSGVSVKNVNHGKDYGNKYEIPEESFNSAVSSHCNATTKKQIVSSSTTRKNHVGNIGIYFKDKSTVRNLYTAKLRLVIQLEDQNSERIRLEDLQHFVNDFTKRRQELRIRKTDVLLKLSEMCDRHFAKNCLWQFESFNVFVEQICRLKPQLEQWLENFHISERDVSIAMLYKQILKSAFGLNQNPAADMIDNLAKLTNLDKDILTFYFNKRRQIDVWKSTPTA